MHRLFVALRPPPPLRAILHDMMSGIDHARWQDDSQLHLTLRYIGEVERPVAEDIATILGTVRAGPVQLALSGVGRFDTRGRPNSVWAGVTPHEGVGHLHRKIDRALVRIGLPPERRAFLPHVTLARLSGGAGPVDAFLRDHAGLTSETVRFEHFILYESHLGRERADYAAIARYGFAADR